MTTMNGIRLIGIFLPIYLFCFSLSRADNSYTFESGIIMQAIPADSGAYFEAELSNTGDQNDTYIVAKEDNIPDSWSCFLCIDSLCLPGDSGEVSLSPGEISMIKPEIYPQDSPGDGEVLVTVQSQRNPDDIKQILFRAVSGHPTLLLANGTEENQYRSYYESSLNASGIGFNFWDRNFSTFLISDLINFDNLLIYTGDRVDDIFTVEEVTDLVEYLVSGGNIFITGQGAASGLQWTPFLYDYFGVQFVDTYDYDPEIFGILDDPIGDGLRFWAAGGDGANNQVELDEILPSQEGYVSFVYSTGPFAGVRKSTGDYRVVFLAFGFEAIDNESDRNEIVYRVFNWFGETTSIGGDSPEIVLPLMEIQGNYPNPFNASTSIRFSLLEKSDITVEIYDILGQQVAVLFEGEMPAGEHAIAWDAGELSSGVYFARLKAPQRSASLKMVLLR
jgi:hypothetical protein